MTGAQEPQEGQGWDGLNNSDALARARRDLEVEQARIDALVGAAFLGDGGRAMLEHLKARVLDPPSWHPGETLERAWFREGQKDVVRQLIASANRAAAKAAGVKPQPQPQE